MTSLKQIEANRRNARKSTGPKSDSGKHHSRQNAIRHGLTAETVIDGLENPEDYKGFEAATVSDYDAQSAVERELVLRLASLLWRLRRATSIETSLLQIQGEILREFRQTGQIRPQSDGRVLGALFRVRSPEPQVRTKDAHNNCGNGDDAIQNDCGDDLSDSCPERTVDIRLEIARCFLRLVNLDKGVFERLNRYETTLWRHVGQTLFALEALRRRNPTER
jgi:hypothetical protein